MKSKQLFYFLITLFFSLNISSAQQLFSFVNNNVNNDSGVSAGICWGDYDNDGLDDLFITNWQHQNNYLYHNDGGGNFTRIITGEIVNDGGFSSGATFGDYDNDDDLDLFVTNQQNQNNFLYQNNGDGTFLKITDGDIVNDYGDSYSATWCDFDKDGFLDLFVANGSGQNNFLYKNNGDNTFKKITNGEIVNDGGTSYGASWADYNNDGLPDLFVANKNNENNFLYKNMGDGSFSKMRSGAIVNDGGNSNGGSWADYDNDGDLDLFVANGPFFFKGQNDFLYENFGDGNFKRIANSEIVTDSLRSMSGTWEDFDSDGDLDLFVTSYMDYDVYFSNNGDGTFSRDDNSVFVNFSGFSSGAGAADYDNDGDFDLCLANWQNQNNTIWINNSYGSNWLEIKCIGEESNRSAIGARIIVTSEMNAKTSTQIREINTNYGFRSQSSLKAHIGLGSATKVESLEIRWPSGAIDRMTNLEVNQSLTVRENKGIIKQTRPKVADYKKSIVPVLLQTIQDKDTDEALKQYRELRQNNSEEYDFGEQQLNILGYTLLGQQKVNDALKIFVLNTEIYPKSANVYDSLAETYLAIGDSKNAIITARKVLEVINQQSDLTEQTRDYLINTAKYRIKNFGQ